MVMVDVISESVSQLTNEFYLQISLIEQNWRMYTSAPFLVFGPRSRSSNAYGDYHLGICDLVDE